jgi:uncharacterized repeat protein (TIGR02543 family)
MEGNNMKRNLSKFNQKSIVSMLLTITMLLILIVPAGVQAIPMTSLTTSEGNTSFVGSGAVAVDPTIAVAGGTISGARVMFENLYSGDVLSYTGTLPTGVTSDWNSITGILTFSGSASAADWQTLLRTVTFDTTSDSLDTRSISFSLGSAITLNGHYYESVNGEYGWTTAKANAETRTYFGMSGYLATITSAEENDFIREKLQADAWIGSSDDYSQINGATGTTTYEDQEAAEGNWYWVTGPEAGTLFSVGNNSPAVETGRYMNWNDYEPNDSDGIEHYGQIYSTENVGKWNDLPNSNDLGYVVEFGGMAGDPDLHVSDTKDVIIVETYDIDYFLNGGTNYPGAPAAYTNWTETFTLGTPTKAGYSFAGWYDREEEGRHIAQIEQGSTGDWTLYAKWIQTPAAPSMLSRTATSITLVGSGSDGKQYRVNEGPWQSSTLFSGLTPDTNYSFEVRTAATQTDPASSHSSPSVFRTNKICIVLSVTGNSVTGVGGVSFDPNTQLVITQIDSTIQSSGTSAFLVNQTLNGINKGIADLYDISLLLDGVPVQPGGTIQIRLVLSAKLLAAADTLQIIYVGANGQYTVIPHTIEGNMIVFEIDHLSQFAVVTSRVLADDGNLAATGEISDGMTWVAVLLTLPLISWVGMVLVYPRVRRSSNSK